MRPMNEHDWLAERFEKNRTHLRAVAYRMLGSLSEADDAVTITRGKIVEISLVAVPERLRQLDVAVLDE
jgi:hypothetical protein